MQVLVTGAAGFVGSALAAGLRTAAQVHAVVHPRTDISRLRNVHGITVHRVDLNDTAALAAIVHALGPISVIHAAAARGHREGTLGGRLAGWTDTVLSTVSLLDSLAPSAVERFVYIGSSTEYTPSVDALRESDPCEPASARGAAKHAATIAVRQWALEHHVALTELRLFRVYGPGESSDRLVATLARALRTGEAVPTPPRTTRRDMVYVDDVVEACLRAMYRPPSPHEIFNVGFGVAYSVEEIIDVVETIAGARIATRPGDRVLAVHDVEHWQADMTHTEAVLGWRPTIDVWEGLGRTLAAS